MICMAMHVLSLAWVLCLGRSAPVIVIISPSWKMRFADFFSSAFVVTVGKPLFPDEHNRRGLARLALAQGPPGALQVTRHQSQRQGTVAGMRALSHRALQTETLIAELSALAAASAAPASAPSPLKATPKAATPKHDTPAKAAKRKTVSSSSLKQDATSSAVCEHNQPEALLLGSLFTAVIGHASGRGPCSCS